MLSASALNGCCSRLSVQRSGQYTALPFHRASAGLRKDSSRAQRLCVCAKKKQQRQAPRAAKTEAEKKPAVLEQEQQQQQQDEVAQPSGAFDTAELSTAPTSPEQELLQPQPVVQDVQLSISQEDLKSLKAAMQNKPRAAVQDPGLIEGILEEVRLISWPNPLQALSDTFVVIGIVGGTAVTLFFVNSLLADISNRIY